jgi:hypothetical protein
VLSLFEDDHTLLIYLVELIPFWMGDILKPAGLAAPDYFMGLKYAVANLLLGIIPNSVFVGLLYLFLIFLFYAIVRRERIAFGLAWLFFSSVMILIFGVGEGSPWTWIMAPLVALAIVITISRFGLLAMMVFHVSFLVSFSTPMTADLSKPYASITAFHLVLLLALAIYGFKTSLAGQKIFRSLLPGD